MSNHMTPECPEWEHAWNTLASDKLNGGDPACTDSDSGERWQYMGTTEGEHTFRHRMHPKFKNLRYIKIAAIKGGKYDPNKA